MTIGTLSLCASYHNQIFERLSLKYIMSKDGVDLCQAQTKLRFACFQLPHFPSLKLYPATPKQIYPWKIMKQRDFCLQGSFSWKIFWARNIIHYTKYISLKKWNTHFWYTFCQLFVTKLRAWILKENLIQFYTILRPAKSFEQSWKVAYLFSQYSSLRNQIIWTHMVPHCLLDKS